jgi:hypothetical protein
MRLHLAFATILFLVAVAAPLPAAAQSRLLIPCGNGPDCSTPIAGYVDMVGTARLPWIATVAADVGLCLNFSIAHLDSVGMVTVIGPDGIVYRSSFRPYSITVYPTKAGFYTLIFDSAPPAGEQLFTGQMQFFAGCTSGDPGK